MNHSLQRRYHRMAAFAITAFACPMLSYAATPSAPSEWSYDYAAANVTLGSEITQEVEYDDEDLLNIFLVRNDRLYEDDKWTKNTDTDDYRIWNIFARIAGKEFVRDHIWRYATFRDPDTGLLAFVQPIVKDKPRGWGLAFNANAADFKNQKWARDTVAVLIHEYAHVLFLNHRESEHKRIKAKYCKDRYVGIMGCAKKDSYIGAYAKAFWTDDEPRSKKKAKSRYKAHAAEYVTWYGGVNPEEDMAESFVQFVLAAKPAGTAKKDKKVLFFYEYPELVVIRDRIRTEVASYYR
jgi:hypothetical protein